VPRKVTSSPLTTTSMFLASRCAWRSSASSMRVTIFAGVARGFSMMSLVTPRTPVSERTTFLAALR